VIDRLLISDDANSNHSNNHSIRIATDGEFEEWWEAVKVVKVDVSYSSHSGASSSCERCPICLDEDITCPVIAPCGHIFNLPCVLGYLNSVAKELNDESGRTKKSTTGNRSVVGTGGSSCSATVTSVRARCPMCSSGSSLELTAGDSVITYKDLRPVQFVPVQAVIAAPVEKSRRKGCDSSRSKLSFVKLHRVKDCSAPYLPLVGKRIRHSLELVDGDEDEDECIYSKHYFVGINEYENILMRNLSSLEKYRESAYCQIDKREAWNVAMAINAVQALHRRFCGNDIGGGFRQLEIDARSNSPINRELIVSMSSSGDEANSGLLQPGTIHASDDEYIWYQCVDGQPVFLTGLSLACLLHEFSLHETASSLKPSRKACPLPDELTGMVLELERQTLTPSLLRRKPFLSHLPLGTEVSFAEIDWYSGDGHRPMLSKATLQKFKPDISRRRNDRLRMAQMENKADRLARERMYKEESRRRRELLGANYVEGSSGQDIDPDDDFFHVPAPSLDEADGQRPRSSSFRFSQVCAENGEFPALSGSVGSTAVLPASTATYQTTWGSSNTKSNAKKTEFPSLLESSRSPNR